MLEPAAPRTPRRIRLSRTAKKGSRAAAENCAPEEYFSDRKKQARLDNSDFDRGLLKAFFDQSLHPAQPPGDSYEVMQLNGSIHFSRLDYEDSRGESLLSQSGRTGPAAIAGTAARNDLFGAELRRLGEAVAGLSLGEGERRQVRELLGRAAELVARSPSSRVLTFGQFLKAAPALNS